MTDAEPPRSLYKYKRMPAAGTEERTQLRALISEGVLWHASPQKLNDPFDCLPAWDGSAAIEDLRELFTRRSAHFGLRAENPKIRKARRDQFVASWRRPQAWEKAWRDVVDQFGVFSMSTVCDSSLMWSHYTNGFAGVCVELDLRTHVLSFPGLREAADRLPLSVSYQEDRPVVRVSDFVRGRIRGDFSSYNSAVLRSLTTKAIEWSYEKEWRLIQYFAKPPQSSARAVRFGPEVVRSVIVGPGVSAADTEELASWIRPRAPKAVVRMAHLDRLGFRVIVEPPPRTPK